MRASVALPLVAVSLWMADVATPVRAGTVRSSKHTPDVIDLSQQDLESSFTNFQHSFNSQSQTYVFQLSDVAMVASAGASCSQGEEPDASRGGGSGGSKRRHAAPTTTKPCSHYTETGTGVTLSLNPYVDSPACGQGGPEPDSKPVGGSGSKRRHATPMGQTPCNPGPVPPAPSKPLLSMNWGWGGQTSAGSFPPDLTQPGGGSTGKRRHASPTSNPAGGSPPSVPEPSALLLLGTGLAGIAVAAGMRRRAQMAKSRR
jgi:PEP-CTERM motif